MNANGKMGAGFLAVWLAFLAGCQSGDKNSPWAFLPGAGDQDKSKVTKAQAADLQVALGRTREKNGETALAIVAYLEAVKRDPHRADAYQRLAILSDRQGKTQEAEEYFRKALAVNPNDAELYCDFGYSFYLQKRWEEARTNFGQALALAPQHSRAHINMGLLLARTGHVEDAMVEFHKGGCDEAGARCNLGFALTMERSLDDARDSYRQALAANPALDRAKIGLHELDALLAKAGGDKAPSPQTPATKEKAATGPVPAVNRAKILSVSTAAPEKSQATTPPRPVLDSVQPLTDSESETADADAWKTSKEGALNP